MPKHIVSLRNELDTFTGQMVDITDPDPETIVIEDIAHALSNLCRYAGHCKKFYSVAEHSVLGSFLVPSRYMRMFMCHDMAEAYCMDIIRPLKRLLGEAYSVYEARFEEVIYTKFIGHVPTKHEHKIIKAADDKMLLCESTKLLACSGVGWADKWANGAEVSDDVQIECWAPVQAEAAFLERWAFLQRRP